eukprot:3803166-Amphidinium_carterae.2
MNEFNTAVVAAPRMASMASDFCMTESLVSVRNFYPPFERLLQLGTSACTDFMLHCLSTGAPPTFVFALTAWGANQADPHTSSHSPLPPPVSCRLLHAVQQHQSDGPVHHRPGRLRRERQFALRVSTFNARSLLEPGKLLFVAKKLAGADIDILCVQESRFRDSFSLSSIEGYQLCTVLADATRGGLLVMIRDKPGLTLLEQHACSARVLRATVKANGMIFHVLNAHAPTEEDAEAEHQLFGEQLLQAVQSVQGTGKTIIGVDLNAKLRGVQGDFSGPLAASSCRYLAAHRQPLLESLDALGFKAMNTHLGPEKGYTWKHPSGSLQQIDFLCACSASAPLVTELHLEPWGMLDLQTTSDHRMVSMTLECGVAVKAKERLGASNFVSDEHFDQFARSLQSSPPVEWDEASSPTEYIDRFMEDMQDRIRASRPLRTPRKPWISAGTWSVMELLNKYRKLLSGLCRGDASALPQLAEAIIQHEGEQFFPSGDADAISGCASAIRSLSAVKKRMIRADRKSWLDELCKKVQGRADSHDLHNFHKTIRQLCHSAKSRKGLRLIDEHGVLVDDPCRVNCMWHQYWRQHFSAADVVPASFADRNSRCTRSVPLSYADSQVVGVFKKKGSPYSMQNFRPVSLMMVEAKLFSRLLLEMLQKRLSQHRAQFGSGASTGTAFPQLVIRQAASAARVGKFASGTVFFDICAAFDRVLTPLLWGCNSRIASGSDFTGMGYSHAQANAIIEFLHAHPPILAACGVPTGILAVLRTWGSHTWITTQSGEPTADTSCRTLLGVKQGDCMAAQVFDIFYGHILAELYQRLRDEDLLIDMTLPVGRALDHLAHDGQVPQTVQLGPVAFRDDLSIPLWRRSNQELMTKVVRVTRVVQQLHSMYHLEINYKPSKSEATLALCQPDAKSLLQGLKQVGKAQKLPGPALSIFEDVNLLVTRAYAHLGCMHMQDLNLSAEVTQMLSRARAALREKKPALRSKHIGLPSKVGIHAVYIRCHLLQNVAILQPFGQVQMQRLQAEYLRGLRLWQVWK